MSQKSVDISRVNRPMRYYTRDLALASMARYDPHASSTAAVMRGKVGSEFET